MSPPNITGNHSNREAEEREIKESLSRRVHMSEEEGGGGGGTLSFWQKYLELQVREWVVCWFRELVKTFYREVLKVLSVTDNTVEHCCAFLY